MESIKNFSKFEGNEISNLKSIKGGAEVNTSGGAGQDAGGNCYTYTSDSLNTVSGQQTCCGVRWE